MGGTTTNLSEKFHITDLGHIWYMGVLGPAEHGSGYRYEIRCILRAKINLKKKKKNRGYSAVLNFHRRTTIHISKDRVFSPLSESVLTFFLRRLLSEKNKVDLQNGQKKR